MRNKHYQSRFRARPGLPPGSPVYDGHFNLPSNIDHIQFNESEFFIRNGLKPEEIQLSSNNDYIHWFKVSGISNIEVITQIGQQLGLHVLLLEDIVNTAHLPKVEFFDNYIFMAMKNIHVSQGQLCVEHFSMVLGANYLVSFEEKPASLFDPIIERIKTARGLVRKRKADYLFYLLMDAIVDNYSLVFTHFENRLDDIEEKLIKGIPHSAEPIVHIKKQLAQLKKLIFPLREETRRIQSIDSSLINSNTRRFIADVTDHVNHIAEDMEEYRDMIAGLLDLNAANATSRMNSIMKTLTVISTIFIPLTFIVGVYGMNFHYMPELDKPWAYPLLWGIMIAIGVGMAFYMKKRKWF